MRRTFRNKLSLTRRIPARVWVPTPVRTRAWTPARTPAACLISLAGLIACSPSFARQPPALETLDDYIAYAVEHNPMWKAYADLEDARRTLSAPDVFSVI